MYVSMCVCMQITEPVNAVLGRDGCVCASMHACVHTSVCMRQHALYAVYTILNLFCIITKSAILYSSDQFNSLIHSTIPSQARKKINIYTHTYIYIYENTNRSGTTHVDIAGTNYYM